MKTVAINNSALTGLYHPVGEYIGTTLPQIYEMVDTFIDLWDQEWDDKHALNIWCSGSSGAIIATVFADRMYMRSLCKKVTITYVRKPEEEQHHSNQEYTPDPDAVNIFVDDFISGGTTLRRIQDCYAESFPDKHVDVLMVTKYVHHQFVDTILPHFVISERYFGDHITYQEYQEHIQAEHTGIRGSAGTLHLI